MWVSVEAKFGMGDKRMVLIPLARLKAENGELRVPYSKDHVGNTPELDHAESISPECDRALRDHYGIDCADQELRGDNDSYRDLGHRARGRGTARVENPGSLETPNADKISDETRERLHNPGDKDTRDVDAGAIADENAAHEKGDGEGEDEDDTDSSELQAHGHDV